MANILSPAQAVERGLKPFWTIELGAVVEPLPERLVLKVLDADGLPVLALLSPTLAVLIPLCSKGAHEVARSHLVQLSAAGTTSLMATAPTWQQAAQWEWEVDELDVPAVRRLAQADTVDVAIEQF